MFEQEARELYDLLNEIDKSKTKYFSTDAYLELMKLEAIRGMFTRIHSEAVLWSFCEYKESK